MIAGWYPNPEKSLHHGIFIKRHAEAIAIKNNVTVLHIFASNKNEIVINEKENLNEILISYEKKSSLINGFKFISSYFQLKNEFNKAYELVEKNFGKPSIIHHHIAFPQGIFAAMLSKKYNIPFILSEQWSGYLPQDNSYQNPIVKYFTKKTIQQASAITTVSDTLMKAMLNHQLIGKYTIIPNIVDTEKFTITDKKQTNSVCKILHVSSLNDKEKNISNLLESLAIVKIKDYHFEIDVIGDGSEKPEFEALSKKLNLEDYVLFRGSKSPEELVGYYQEADFFLLTSNYETFCVVLIEALACGLPIVTTNAGAVCEIVNETNGLIAEENKAEAIADIIIEMIKNHSKYNAQNLRSGIINKYNSITISNKFNELYHQILNTQ